MGQAKKKGVELAEARPTPRIIPQKREGLNRPAGGWDGQELE